MLNQAVTSLAAVANGIIRGFLLPGDFLLSALSWAAPEFVKILTIGTGKPVVTFVLALVGWTIILVIGLLISKICRGLVRQINAMFRILLWQTKMLMGSLKTRLLWKYREFFGHPSEQAETVAQAQFDDMDIAVLASMSRSGPGAASSAARLAQKYKLQPAQVQKRLDRLTDNQLLRSVSSSKGKHDDYKLTDSGLALLAMCEQQAAARTSLAV